MELRIRALRADEVECRIAQVGSGTEADELPWITALLYKMRGATWRCWTKRWGR